MKKIAVSIVAVALLAGVAATSAFAVSVPAGRFAGSGFVDENGDGVCDNYTVGRGAGFADEDGDGVCDNYTAGRGAGFVDEDGDGVCDNWPAGCGAGFVDEDGDSVCDNYATGCGRRAGRMGRNS